MYSLIKLFGYQPRKVARRRGDSGQFVALAAFHERGFVLSRFAPAGSPRLRARVQSLPLRISGNNTNVNAGLDAAFRLLPRGPRRNRCRIVILTDGAANAGGTSASAAGRCRAAGVAVDIIHLGGWSGASMLHALARQTGGRYTSAADSRAIVTALRAVGTHPLIALIDTSGSMLQSLETGRRRIDAVAAALNQFLNDRPSRPGR